MHNWKKSLILKYSQLKFQAKINFSYKPQNFDITLINLISTTIN